MDPLAARHHQLSPQPTPYSPHSAPYSPSTNNPFGPTAPAPAPARAPPPQNYRQLETTPYYPKPPTPSWPSSPLIKPNSVGGTTTQQPITWPERRSNSSNPQFLNREPRSPIREESRRTNSNPSHNKFTPSQSISNPSHLPPSHQPQILLTKITVIAIERNRRDTYIKFDAWSHLTANRNSHSPNVSRAYKEFLLFHESLTANNPHTIVPPVPFPNTSAPNSADDDRLVASAFQQFFDRLLLNPFLKNDNELRAFIESDFGYTPQTKPKRRTISTGSGWLSKPTVGSSVRTLPSSSVHGASGSGPDTIVSVVEEDELSNAKLQFRLLEDRLVECCKSVEQLARSKRSFSQALLELCTRITQFSTTESHGALAEGLRKLGQTIRSISELETNSSIGYLVTLSDGLSWCAISAKAAKEVLRNRAGVLQEHYSSVKKSIEKRRLIERIKSNSLNVSSERVENALNELEEAKKNETIISSKALLISNHLRPSLRTHSEFLHDDLLYSLMENARTQLIYEKQILKELERVKPELDSISLKPTHLIYHHNNNNNNCTDETNDRREDQQQHREESEIDPQQRRINNQSSSTSADQERTISPNQPNNFHIPHSSSKNKETGSRIINYNHIQPTPVRVSEISKHLIVHDNLGINIDARQRVDAKSAAASLARLF